MPKYYEFKVCGYYLYYTASCVIEAMHLQEYLESREDGNPALFMTLRAPLGEYRLVGHRRIDTTLRYAMVKQSNVKIAHRKYIG